jgi:hypothetical protein
MTGVVDIRLIGAPEPTGQAAARLGELFALDRYDGPRRPRAQAVRAAVAWFGHYRAGQLLHPLEPHSRGGERR